MKLVALALETKSMDCRTQNGRMLPPIQRSDMRNVAGGSLAAELSKIFQPYNRKIAVLCPVERFDDAAFFALCAENRGFRVKAFTSFEDAIDWLIEMEPAA